MQARPFGDRVMSRSKKSEGGVAAPSTSCEDLKSEELRQLDDVITNWAYYLEVRGWRNRDRPSLRFMSCVDTVLERRSPLKTHGTIIEQMNHQYSLIMKQPSTNTKFEDFIQLLENHPLLAIGSGLSLIHI